MNISIDLNVNLPEAVLSFFKSLQQGESPEKAAGKKAKGGMSVVPEKETAPASPGTQSAESSTPETAAAPKQENVTLEALRALATPLLKSKKADVAALIQSLGAEKLADLPKDQYQAAFEGLTKLTAA